MQLELLNEQGQATAKVDAPDTVFARDYNEALVHQVVVAYQANARQGTRAQKNREAVKHSTKKPWRQKGTGRARAGMTSSPLWRGGGRIFPNSPDENFTQKVNKKMYRAGMASILSQLARDGRLAVVDSIKVESPKGEDLRHVGPMIGGESGPYMLWNRNKRGITLDMKQTEDKAMLLALLAHDSTDADHLALDAWPRIRRLVLVAARQDVFVQIGDGEGGRHTCQVCGKGAHALHTFDQALGLQFTQGPVSGHSAHAEGGHQFGL